MSNPLVTIWCSAYNQQKYIAQAIEGFVMQKTNFPVEIYVHDDASTDDTANIIREYAVRHSQIIPICLTENKFSVDKSYLNRIMFEKAKGKYIAMCEGDDYWTDSSKLQKQVDFLESDPDYSICFHNVKIIHEDGSREPHLSNANQKSTTTFADLAQRNYIHTVSCVFRNDKTAMPEWFYKMSAGDWVLHLLNAEHGKIGYLDEVMAVYRVHQGGIWSMKKREENALKWIPIVEQCRQHFYPRGKAEFSEQLAGIYANLCFDYFDAARYEECRRAYKSALPLAKYLKKRSLIALTNRYWMSFFPQLAARYRKLRVPDEG